MKKFLGNLIVLGCVVVFCLFIGEIIVRVFYKRLHNYNMEMWRYASELKQPLPYTQLPFHHFPDKEGRYYGVNIKTNSFGLRDYEYNIEKPEGKKRIIFLGDSFTLGWGVPLETLFSKQIERMLNKRGNNYEVINMGAGNYNSTMETELFKLKGLGLNPDLVILMYFINDVEPVPRKISTPEYIVKKHSYFFAFLFDRYVKLRLRFDRDFEWSKYYSSLYSVENLKSLASNKESIKELIRLCKKNNIKLLIVNIPELRVLREYPFSFATEYIKGLAEETNVPFLDLLPSFAGHEPESLWTNLEDPHANAKANSITAQVIYKKILNEGLIPFSP